MPLPAKRDNRLTIKVTIGYLAVYAVVMITIAGALAFWYSRSNTDQRAVIGYGSSLFGAMVALVTLLYTAQSIREANDEKKQAGAARFIERWNEPAFMVLKNGWWKMATELDPLCQEERARLLRDDLQKRRTATEVLNFFEEMAVAINTNVVDERTPKALFPINSFSQLG